MKYYMKQRLFSIGNDFRIFDENNEEAFYVDGKAFTIGDHLLFQDKERNTLCEIRQKLLTFRPTYIIREPKPGNQLAKIRKALMTFRDTFIIDVPGPNDITVTGKWVEHEYTFKRNKKVIATVSKKWFRQSDTYGIDIVHTGDTILVLASAVVIDIMCHKGRSNIR
ncbi:MAG: hypothetical protein D6719_01870 [Candidatus Dadabacteria bacterium]|nr:MAG: hypothetical protein D6719_01870 [Candidatus Dadabacteria bacterium]